MRKSETIVKKDLAHFLPHMSAALSLFIALQSEAQFYGLLLKENTVLRGAGIATVWQSCLGSGWTSAVTIAQSLCSTGPFVFGCHGCCCTVVRRDSIVFIVYMGG